jgi:broad specificity phosphatase PhoE
MTAPLQIYLIRHGETAWSLTGQHTSVTELPLTPRGEAAACGLAAMLDGIAFSRVLTSPRLRAHHTCELAGLAGQGATAAQVEPELAEWDYGLYEGLRTANIHGLNPDWDLWRDGCPQGETPAEVAVRTDALIERLCSLNGNIALFSHGHFGRALAARWIGLPVYQGRHFSLDPASVSVLGFDEGHLQRRVISLWNVKAAPFR